MHISDHVTTVKETIRSSFNNCLNSSTLLQDLHPMPKPEGKASHLCLKQQINSVIGHCYLTLDSFLWKNPVFTAIKSLTTENLDDITEVIQLYEHSKNLFRVLGSAMKGDIHEYIDYRQFWYNQINVFIEQCQFIIKNFFIALCPSHFEHSDPGLLAPPPHKTHYLPSQLG